ncbi:Cytochrome c oxidase subunit III [Pragia fontium]|uniref:cbb3-type cytochrome c oxidase subunit II n=1 Tax=Pragia fontium TaxID=82985 RepID=UPI000DFCABF3|nr:cbb3-type cytochrome c oxidase subunit II [Pragia fontium]SUB82786.1 Cytochrome c oxidase subunit III [Pragia fontium]
MKQRQSGKFFSFSLVVMFVAGVGFFFLSIVALGILPGIRLEQSIAENAPVNYRPYTEEQQRGRTIYAAEGCAYCHTQQVRFTPEDRRRWGPSTEPWETKYDSPHLWGTRRVGPDLARESEVRSNDWQYTHLYNPRYIVPNSVMPGYAWMFDGSADKPLQPARDLVAYLQILGRERQDLMANDPQQSQQIQANPARTLKGASGDVLTTLTLPTGDQQRGQTVWNNYCSACHGAQADGNSVAAHSLLPRPTNLTAFSYDPLAFATILHNGVAGSSMPAWRDLSPQQVADIYAWLTTLRTKADNKALSTASIAQGAELFANNCTSCHGVNGDGQGPAAALYKPAPFDFLHQQPDAQEIDRVLRQGVPGTAMPPFPTMSAAQRAALASYVRSLHQPEKAANTHP